MRLDKIRDVLVSIENRVEVNAIKAEGVHLWPILRLCIWHQLAIGVGPQQELEKRERTPFKKGIDFALKLAGKIKNSFAYYLMVNSHISDSETVFFTRPVYLQTLESNLLFDRIVDPLIDVLNSEKSISKYCLSSGSKPSNLYFDVDFIGPNDLYFPNISYEIAIEDFNEIAKISGLDLNGLLQVFKNSCVNYFRWYALGKKLFSRTPSIKKVYVTSWYFPDMMGLISAAKELGLETTDLQHGQQGKYQIMYSWWSKIPSDGYGLIPDRFWCWGQQSVNHIMNVNNNTKMHQAFVGGYPWIDFYKRHLQKPSDSRSADNSREVLFTLQPPSGEHLEPIPDFILDFLTLDKHQSVVFNFRCHPNFKGCYDYIQNRLKNINSGRYRITFGNSILYHDFLTATHHITAFSSCCYEAEVFDIPTLLFGADALENYEDEIKNNEFIWTSGSVEDLVQWMANNESFNNKSNYIVSSKDLARECLQ